MQDFIYTMPQGFMDDVKVPLRWRLLGYLNGFFINGNPVWASNAKLAEKLKATTRGIQKAINELEEIGLVECERTKTSRVIYQLNRKKVAQKHAKEVRTHVHGGMNTDDTNPRTRVHPNSVSNSVSIIPEVAEATSENEAEKSIKNTPQKIAEVIKQFAVYVDPKNKQYYGRKDMRKACDFLISEYGFETVMTVVQNLHQIVKKVKYVGSITTPVQLVDKWQAIKQQVEIKKGETRNVFMV